MRKKNRIVIGFVLFVVAAGLILPMPGGGSLGGYLLGGKAGVQDDETARVYKELRKRFRGTLPFVADVQKTAALRYPHWQAGSVGDVPAWLDEQTGMIYSGRTGMVLKGWTEKEHARARQYCKDMEPAGAWSLPTETEMEIGKNHGLIEHERNFRRRWLASYISINGYYDGASMRKWGGPSGYINVLCVGRSETAPLHGFIRDDVDSNYNIL